MKFNCKAASSLLLALVLTCGCEEDEVPPPVVVPGMPPAVVTSAPTNVLPAQATANGSVNPNHLQTTVVFEYGTTTSFGSQVAAMQSPVSGSSGVNVSAVITGL